MKTIIKFSFFFLLIFMIFSCKKETVSVEPIVSIIGKWKFTKHVTNSSAIKADFEHFAKVQRCGIDIIYEFKNDNSVTSSGKDYCTGKIIAEIDKNGYNVIGNVLKLGDVKGIITFSGNDMVFDTETTGIWTFTRQ
jgi:hypothetical protein